MKHDTPISILPEVGEAMAAGRAVVALESTIISHGMPYPRNVETAMAVEGDVRAAGAVPATIAILDGAYQIGLAPEQLDDFGRRTDIMKASRRDLGVALAGRLAAATTVATTMIGAALAGIRVFATGGTGGVHRGGEDSLDVSADLQELARTPVAVVSAGVKSILDIPRTLEYLETLGVPVITLGSADFPAFYSRTSGHKSPLHLDSIPDMAAALSAHWSIPGAAGALIANPIPESDAMEFGFIEGIIEQAVGDAERNGIHGKELTPFLLSRIVDLSDGQSLEANIALVRNNARVAAGIATRL